MRCLLVLFILQISILSFGQQSGKISVAIPGFRTSNSSISSETSSSIHQRVIDAFVNNSRFSVVERNQLEELQKEVNLQRTEAFMDGNTNISDKVKNSGANYLVTGVISRVDYSSERKEKKEYDLASKSTRVTGTYEVYQCTIELNLKLIDVTTSQIVLSEVLSSKGGSSGSLLGDLLSTTSGTTSPEKAYEESLGRISAQTNAFIKEAFPNVLSIAEITSRDKRGNAEELLLVGDFTDGMGKKQDLYVKLVTESVINGKKMTRKKIIGEVRVIKVEEGGFITVKVRDGEEEITKAFEAKQSIQITENN